eukprot:CAMPEP_0197288254 /NCGR_PEP_ID=MMETSP0890-20130614/5265_1 /TAXON_ID=44058 ORGANISM="Aureoumbra lagunensis, Strain CCMP1510" /NCGR_SAMPLE_ID=MMETSP0890 /ASSEMBLY_ACC=CAM_ASM_000533 /LENGTH=141 /DNA_ID=CAMNT_0042758825 /DNA_START=1060 /DNA_END=1485 /DNA_ORIENTATION=+
MQQERTKLGSSQQPGGDGTGGGENANGGAAAGTQQPTTGQGAADGIKETGGDDAAPQAGDDGVKHDASATRRPSAGLNLGASAQAASRGSSARAGAPVPAINTSARRKDDSGSQNSPRVANAQPSSARPTDGKRISSLRRF